MEGTDWNSKTLADIAETLSKTVDRLRSDHEGADFSQVCSSLQELSLRITQLSSGKAQSSADLEERRNLVQKSRQCLQDAEKKLREENVDIGLSQTLKGCLVAFKAAEHTAKAQVISAVQPVFQTLAILEKSTTSERLILNVKLLGMRLIKFLELGSRLVHDLEGPKRRVKVQMHVYVIQKLIHSLVQSVDNSIHRPMNANDRASRTFFFSTVKQSTEAVTKLFTNPNDEKGDLFGSLNNGKFVGSVDSVLENIDSIKTIDDFEKVQAETEWLISFAMSVAKVFGESQDEKDIINGCHHLVHELGNLKDAIYNGNVENLALAKEVAKDFTEVTEQSVNSALLRLIVTSLCQLHVPLDRLIHAVLSSDKMLPDRLQDDLSHLIDIVDNHADRIFHISHFAIYCTSDATTAQALTNSLQLAQILEKELVPACLKLYFSPEDIGARSHLRTLRQLWRAEVENIETCILNIVDPTAFCVIVEAEARRIASCVKKDQYSQDRDWLRLSVSQIVRLCQMAVDFAWKEMSSEAEGPNRLPDDHPIIRVERSTWEVQAALKLVIANVEDLHAHKAMIRRVQLMVTCTTAMVECLADGNKTENGLLSQTGVKVLTSVSRVNISFGKSKNGEALGEVNDEELAHKVKYSTRILSKSFKNITMNNTIGLGGKTNLLRNLEVISINEGIMSKSIGAFPFSSRKMAVFSDSLANNTIEELGKAASTVEPNEMENSKAVFRKVKLHSNSEGFRSPLKQINSQIVENNPPK